MGGKGYTQEQALNLCRKIHGDKYDYSLFKYVDNATRVQIICKIHGEFSQIAGEHFRGRGCRKCALEEIAQKKRLPLETVKSKIASLNNTSFDLSLMDIDYKNTTSIVKIICPTCKKQFSVKVENALRAPIRCSNCVYVSPRKYTTEEFIERAQNVFQYKYDYSKVVYTDSHQAVTIGCPIHGDFSISAYSHLAGKGCVKCGRTHSAKNRASTTEKFIEKARKVHGDLYDYSQVHYTTALQKVGIVCPEHGIFFQKANSHLSGFGCPVCRWSRGEKEIYFYLKNKGITFTTQQTFPGCKSKAHLRFDFWIPSIKTCIEFDGEQHFNPMGYFGGGEALKYNQHKDRIKDTYCRANDINLLRIKYTDDIQARLDSLFVHKEVLCPINPLVS